MKRFTALACVLALLLTPCAARAADRTDTAFPAVHTAVSFPDVPAGAWYESAATICYEIGLLNGTDTGFSPSEIVTIAQAATLAARIHNILAGGDGVLPTADPWYASAVEYMEGLGISGIVDPTQPASRRDFFILLSVVLTDAQLAPINSITALPDVSDPTLLAFYNAGILTGTDDYGTFSPNQTLTRAEMATMAARIARPALRVSFTPVPSPTTAPSGSVVAILNGQNLYEDTFFDALDASFAAAGVVVDWSADYGVGDLSTYFIEQALYTMLYDALVTQYAAQLGLPVSTADGAYAALASRFAADALRAKHILFSTVDENTVPLSDTLRAGALTKAEIYAEVLQYDPTEALFDTYMNQVSEDPGLAYYPNGYVFGAGEMTAPFEAAVRALPVGGVSGVVESEFGYHIILRLDPQDDPEELDKYAYDTVYSLLNQLLQVSDLSISAALDSFDCEGYYGSWLAWIGY